MLCGIYTINNILNGRVYVGSTANARRRFSEHRRHLEAGTHHCGHLQHAWNKYGRDAFIFEVRLTCPKEDLLGYEQMLLDEIAGLYNSTKTAGSSLGVKHSAETRARMSEAAKKRSADPAWRARHSARLKKHFENTAARALASEKAKKRFSMPEERAKAAEQAKVRVYTPETRARMSAAQRARFATPEGKAHQIRASRISRDKMKARNEH